MTVDAAVVRRGPAGLEVLLIERGREPFRGKLAFPGGFVDQGEDPAQAVLRELHEECGLRGRDPELITVRGDPDRDPRKHIVTILYGVTVDAGAEPIAGDDAAEARFVAVDEIKTEDLAGDHADLLAALLSALNS
jgi:8-oxo-dGTP diphosphatase